MSKRKETAGEEPRVDLEIQLAADKKGELMNKIKGEIQEAQAQAEKLLKSGLSRDEYQSMQKVKDGLQASETILEIVWHAYRKSD